MKINMIAKIMFHLYLTKFNPRKKYLPPPKKKIEGGEGRGITYWCPHKSLIRSKLSKIPTCEKFIIII